MKKYKRTKKIDDLSRGIWEGKTEKVLETIAIFILLFLLGFVIISFIRL